MQEQGAVSNQHILGRATVQWQRGRKNRPKTRDPARTGHGEADSRHPIQQGPKRVAVKTTNARSPRPEPTQSLVGRVVVNAEVLRDPADAGTSVVHRAADGGNDLVDRDNERVGNANVGNKTTEGSESFSPRPLRSRQPQRRNRTAADESDQVFELLAGHGKLRLLATANVGNVAVQLGDLVGNTPKGMPDGSRIKEPIGEATKEDALQLGRRPNSPEERG